MIKLPLILKKVFTVSVASFFLLLSVFTFNYTFLLESELEAEEPVRASVHQKHVNSILDDAVQQEQEKPVEEQEQRILVSIPTYNEKGNIRPLYEALKSLPINLEILFIDDNSPDGTRDAINDLCDEDCSVHGIHRKGKLGLGSAHMRGLNFALQNGYSHVITMDADFLHDPKYIPEMVEKSKTADIVIGSRYVKGGAYDAVEGTRKYLTYFWRWCIKSCLGLNYDATGSYRMYNVKILDPEVLKKVKAKGFDFNLETLYRLKKAGATITEVPIQAHARLYGQTKLTARDQKAVWGNFCSLCWDKFRG